MKILLSILVCLFCTEALAQVRWRGDAQVYAAPHRTRSEEDWRQRREQMQAFRQEIRRLEVQRQENHEQRQAERNVDQPHQPERIEVSPEADTNRGLRRLSPNERLRLRQEMRDAYRH
jgi:hypothetical protein